MKPKAGENKPAPTLVNIINPTINKLVKNERVANCFNVEKKREILFTARAFALMMKLFIYTHRSA